jgi:hypothetical protein
MKKFLLFIFVFISLTHSLFAHQKKNGGLIVEQRLAIIMRNTSHYINTIDRSTLFQEEEEALFPQGQSLFFQKENIKKMTNSIATIGIKQSDYPCLQNDKSDPRVQEICLNFEGPALTLETHGDFYTNLPTEQLSIDFLKIFLQINGLRLSTEEIILLNHRITFHALKKEESIQKGIPFNVTSQNPPFIDHFIVLSAGADSLSEFKDKVFQLNTLTSLSYITEDFLVLTPIQRLLVEDNQNFYLSLGFQTAHSSFVHSSRDLEQGKATQYGITPYCTLCIPLIVFGGIQWQMFNHDDKKSMSFLVAGFNAFYQRNGPEGLTSIDLKTGIGYAFPQQSMIMAELSLLQLWAINNPVFNSIGFEAVARTNIADFTNDSIIFFDTQGKILIGLGIDSLVQLYTGPLYKNHEKSNVDFQWLVGAQFRY